MDNEFYKLIINSGAIVVVFLFTIKEYFSYQKAKKNGNGSKTAPVDKDQTKQISENDKHIAVLMNDVKLIRENELTHIKNDMKRIERDNKQDHKKIFQKLDEILKKKFF